MIKFVKLINILQNPNNLNPGMIHKLLYIKVYEETLRKPKGDIRLNFLIISNSLRTFTSKKTKKGLKILSSQILNFCKKSKISIHKHPKSTSAYSFHLTSSPINTSTPSKTIENLKTQIFDFLKFSYTITPIHKIKAIYFSSSTICHLQRYKTASIARWLDPKEFHVFEPSELQSIYDSCPASFKFFESNEEWGSLPSKRSESFKIFKKAFNLKNDNSKAFHEESDSEAISTTFYWGFSPINTHSRLNLMTSLNGRPIFFKNPNLLKRGKNCVYGLGEEVGYEEGVLRLILETFMRVFGINGVKNGLVLDSVFPEFQFKRKGREGGFRMCLWLDLRSERLGIDAEFLAVQISRLLENEIPSDYYDFISPILKSKERVRVEIEHAAVNILEINRIFAKIDDLGNLLKTPKNHDYWGYERTGAKIDGNEDVDEHEKLSLAQEVEKTEFIDFDRFLKNALKRYNAYDKGEHGVLGGGCMGSDGGFGRDMADERGKQVKGVCKLIGYHRAVSRFYSPEETHQN